MANKTLNHIPIPITALPNSKFKCISSVEGVYVVSEYEVENINSKNFEKGSYEFSLSSEAYYSFMYFDDPEYVINSFKDTFTNISIIEKNGIIFYISTEYTGSKNDEKTQLPLSSNIVYLFDGEYVFIRLPAISEDVNEMLQYVELEK